MDFQDLLHTSQVLGSTLWRDSKAVSRSSGFNVMLLHYKFRLYHLPPYDLGLVA